MKKKPFFYILLMIISWIYTSRFNSVDYDLWARMAVGKMFLQLGHVLKQDIFSFTPIKPLWIDHEWGSGVVFYAANHLFGTTGLFVLKVICVFIILFLIHKIIEIQVGEDSDPMEKIAFLQFGAYLLLYLGISYAVITAINKSGLIFNQINNLLGMPGLIILNAICIFAVLLSIYSIFRIIKRTDSEKKSTMNFGVYLFSYLGMSYGVMSIIRCQIFTFIFFALWIYVLERVRRGENRLLWIFPVTMLIWANLHGGFVSGLGLLLIYGIGEFLNKKPFAKYFIIAVPSLLITAINPYGFKYFEYIFQATTMNRATIQEWHPTSLFGPFYQWKGFKIFLVYSVIGLMSYFVRTKLKYKDIDKTKLLLLSVTMFLSIKYIKHMPLYAIAGGAFLYHDFYAVFSKIGNFLTEKFGNIAEKTLKYTAITKEVILYLFIFFAGIVLIPQNPNKPAINPLKYPLGSVAFIKQNNLTGNVLTLFHWGSFSVWELYPSCYIAEDGRYEEVYPESLHMNVYRFNYAYNKYLRSFLDDFHTDIIIVEKVNKTYPEMLTNKDWTQVYGDFVSAVFIPTKKVRKNYIKPKINWDMIYKDKYITAINFLN